MRPKTYLMSFCLFILYVDVNSCGTSSSRPAAEKFLAEKKNGIWWPTEESADISRNSGSNLDHEHENEHQHEHHHHSKTHSEHQRHSYKLPETSNETGSGMNGHGSSGSKRTNNNSDNNEEQPQIIASREPHHSASYYGAEEREQNGSGRSRSDGSSKDLIESSILSTVSQPNLSNQQIQKEQKQSSSSSSRRLMSKSAQGLGLVHFTNKSITCNDGTPAGYYIRKSNFKGSDDNLWIIFLEGGWYCFDQRSCMTRWHRLKHLMSSEGWPGVKHVGGILSSDPSENPYWWNANHVFVPYCSSDTWSGRVSGNENGNPFSFMGALIIDEVIKSLINIEGLDSDSSIILAGSSAGGTGVMINVDHVESLLTREFGSPHGMQRVKGITDSGWFIDKVPLYTEKANCHDVLLCPPEISLRKGMNLWNARLPKSCRDSHPDDPWACFFGYRIYPTMKSSLFVFQWLFDEAQMVINNVPTPALRKEEWDYVYRIGDELKKTLMNVTNVFIPSCLAHTVLTHRDWRRVAVNSIELTRALKCWESGGIFEESNFIPRRKSPQKFWEDYELDSSLGPRGIYRHGKLYSSTTLPTSSLTTNRSSNNDNANANTYNSAVITNNSSRRNRRRHNRHRHKQSSSSSNNTHNNNNRQNRRRRKKLEKRQKLQQQRSANNKPKKKEQRQRSIDKLQEREREESARIGGQGAIHYDSLSPTEITSPQHKRNQNNKKKQKKRKRNRRWYSVCDGISNRLIEKCSWPQCGRTCPKLLNPLTGEEVDFKDLLTSFGLDLATMAKALGMDMATLNSMDHHTLLQMLTQHA